jgi:putative membrane-bound dehydrogenase-like protein
MLLTLLLATLAAQDGAPPPPAAPKPSPRSPDEQRATFSLPPGLQIDLVTSEADAPKVVDVAFDDAGRIWAVTATEYPVDGNESPAVAKALYERGGRDRVLVFDPPTGKLRVFADGLAMPMAVLPYRDGALVGHGPEILFLRDTDGDGKADTREVVLSGFGIQDSHLLPHRFVRGPGGWIYLAQGAFNASRVKSRDGKETAFDQCKVGRFKPDGSAFEVVGWGLNNIWGFVIDPRGDFWIQEANDLGYSVVPFKVGASYPGIGMHRAKPYAPWEPPLASFRMGGTGLSGLALAENLGAWSGSFILANPITRRLQAIRAHPDGRLEKLPDFLLSSDEWFRPVAVHTGPDSALYVVDWYNKIISHNEVPRNHPERDKFRGRVWRIRASERPVRNVAKTPDADLPDLLSSASAWEARAARNQIVDRAAKPLAPALAEVAKSGPLPARLLAMDAIDQLGGKVDDALLRDPERAVRRDAVRILKTPLLDDPDPRVREESIRVADFRTLLRAVKPELAGPTVKCEQGGVLALTGEAHDRAFERSLMRSRFETMKTDLESVTQMGGVTNEQVLFAALALEPRDAAMMISYLLAADPRAPTAEEAALLPSHPHGLGYLEKRLKAPESRKATLEALHAVRQRIDAAPLRDALAAALRAEPELLLPYATAFRLAALEPDVVALLPTRPLPALRALREMKAGNVALFKTWAGNDDASVRREAVAALASMDGGELALLEVWPTLTPVLRKVAVDALAGSKARAAVLAQAVKDGRISADDLDAATRDKLAAVLGSAPASGPVLLRLDGKEEDWIPTALDLDGPFTVECWIRLDAGITNADGILGRPGGADFNFHDGRFRLYAGGRGGDVVVAKRPMVAGAWTHVALTRDAQGALRIYLDGEPDAAGRWEGALDKLDVGRTNAAGGTKAELAEYRVWKVARSAEQIREHHDVSIASHPDLRYAIPFGAVWPSRSRPAAEPPPILSEAESRALREKLAKFRALSADPGDATSGQAVFGRTCKACHTLRGEGASIGPNLDGIGLRDPESLLRAIVTPSAAVEPGYRLYRIRTKDGDVVDGLLVREDANELVLRPANAEELRLPRAKVAVGAFTRYSVMPEGLLETLPPKDVSDLFAYMKSAGRPLDPVPATPENVGTFFNGKDLSGWDGNTSLWKVEAGEIVGRTDTGTSRNQFLRSRLLASDFRLTLKVQLVRKNKGFENSGIQFRSQALADGEMKGYQADIGPGWWGKLYEEHGRGLLWDRSGEAHVKDGEWNDYVVEAVGARVRTWINGQPCVDLDDPAGAKSGLIAFQLHSGGPTEIRFKDLRLEPLPKAE